MSRISLEFIPGRERNFSWGRKDEEYIADFTLVSRRTLDEFEYKIFGNYIHEYLEPGSMDFTRLQVGLFSTIR
jgi:hypothetical protein